MHPSPRFIRRIFLAGKITGNDWRRSLLADDPVLPLVAGGRAILSVFDCVGPYGVQSLPGPDDKTTKQ